MTIALAKRPEKVEAELVVPQLPLIRETCEYLQTHEVKTEQEYLDAQADLDTLANLKKELEETRAQRTKVAYDAWQNELKPYKEPLKLLDEGMAKLKELIGSYKLADNARKQQALAKAVEADDEEAIEAASQPTAKGSASVSVSYGFRIVNPKLVPDEYCVKTPNCRLIEIAVDEGAREIPGVEIYPKANVRRVGRKSKDV